MQYYHHTLHFSCDLRNSADRWKVQLFSFFFFNHTRKEGYNLQFMLLRLEDTTCLIAVAVRFLWHLLCVNHMLSPHVIKDSATSAKGDWKKVVLDKKVEVFYTYLIATIKSLIT